MWNEIKSPQQMALRPPPLHLLDPPRKETLWGKVVTARGARYDRMDDGMGGDGGHG